VSEEVFLDWFFMSLIAWIIWFMGYLSQPRDPQISSGDIIRIPSWLATLAGRRRRDNLVDARSFVIQMYGLSLFIFAIFLVLFEPDHQRRVIYFRNGFIFLLLVSAIFLEVLLIYARRR